MNSTETVDYVGAAVCGECHSDQQQTFLETAHSRALDEIELSREPPDAEFVHALSGRSYRVYRQGGQLRHREMQLDDAGAEIAYADYPMRYVIGSGHHSRSYLVHEDGFLFESPVTWYTSKQEWAMSPGYDRPLHMGFERMADLGCIHCHAGRVEAADGNRFRVRILERAVGCESCHGPGSLHVARHRGEQPVESLEDLTIVNPKKLSREANESVCALCHLRGAATVWVHGRDPLRFRPGLLLSDFRMDYTLEHPDRSMKVVGHVEQMRLSRCYQQSETMTCTTCHDPHGRPAEATKWNYYREKCGSCHDAGCGLDTQTRLQRNAEDNCVACHMPQSATDIPHFAFTHHRIGLHATGQLDAGSAEGGPGRLVPMFDDSHLPQPLRDRSLGLAYLEFSEQHSSDAAYREYRGRALRLLGAAYEQGVRDAEFEAALARIAWENEDLARAVPFAEAALQQPAFTSAAHSNALFVLGESHLQMNNVAAALDAFQQLVQYRRLSEDWLLLAVCRERSGDRQGALAALQRAAEIAPLRGDVHQLLADGYQSVGRTEEAEKHRRIAGSVSRARHP